MSTKRQFRDRVEAEREVLRLINRPLFAPVELCRQVLNDLVQVLREISERCRLNADKSRDVFDEGALVPRGTVEVCVDGLKQQLEALGFEALGSAR